MTDDVPAFLDRDISDDDRREWTTHIAAEVTPPRRGTEAAIVFRIGTEWLALPAKVFEGVARQTMLHTLPHQQRGLVYGIMNVRGELLLCIGLSALLDGTTAVPSSMPSGQLIVAEAAGGLLAFPVDDVYGVVRYHPAELADVPATLANARVRFTTGLLACDGRSVACLDAGLLFSAITRHLA